MNDYVQKIIKASFCPKERWMYDKLAINCFKCDKKFHPLYRRKHHCRYCGQVFCNTCSDFFFAGKDLGESEKTIRMCEACIQKCWKYIAKHDESYLYYRKSGDIEKDLPDNINEIQRLMSRSNFSEEDKLQGIRTIIEEYEGGQSAAEEKIYEEVNRKFSILLQVILKQARVPLKYLGKLLAISHEIVNKVPPNFVITGNMDICQHVQIKCFKSEQFQVSLDPIVLIKKATTSKRLKEYYENMHCILVYGGIYSEDLVGDKYASFENMINNRLKEINKIISYCQRVGINLILLEGAIEKEFEDLLHASLITVVPKVKIYYMSRLRTSLQIGKCVEAISNLYAYPEKEITGVVKKVTSVSYYSLKAHKGIKKYFRISSHKYELGLTLVLQGSDAQALNQLKKDLRFILQTLTHIKLKVYKMKLDQKLLESMSETNRNSCYLNNPEMFFSFYAYHHSDVLNYLKEKYVSYKRIAYVYSNFGCYPYVTKPGLEEYLKGRSHSFKNRWDDFTEICGEIHDEHRIFYSQDDVPIGTFILRRLISLDKKCSICGRPNYLHSYVYYSTDQYVRVWTYSRIVDGEGGIIAYTQQDQKDAEMEMIFSYLYKTAVKEKLKCFIECYDCQYPLSSHEKVYKLDLYFSMLSFLHHMFKSSLETTIRENNDGTGRKTHNKQKTVCGHLKKVRVFELGDKSMKIFVGKYTIGRQCLMTDTGRESFLKGKEHDCVVATCMLYASRVDRIVMFLYEEIKTIAELSKNSKFETMIKDPRQSFIRARQSIGCNISTRLSQAQCIDMILPYLIEEVSKINVVAQLLLNARRVSKYLYTLRLTHVFMTLLKKAYLIISEVKNSVKKRYLYQKYLAKDFDNDFLMGDIDINSIMESCSMDSYQEDVSENTSSEISKAYLYSNYQAMDASNYQIDHVWLQPYKDEPALSRHDRKTESNILAKKQLKASEEYVFKVFKKVSSLLKVDPGYHSFTPCYPNQPQTLISSALNSVQHKYCLSGSIFQGELIIKLSSYTESCVYIDNEYVRKLLTTMEIHYRMFQIHDRKHKEVNNSAYELTLLYPNEFEILRRKKSIPLELFIESVAGAEAWLATGGKSGSSFMRSFNDLIVIKKLPKGYFNTFRRFLPKYFTHLHEGSILTPIYGAFTITKHLTTHYFVAMENLFFGMKEWYLYDFKGSVTRRFSRPPVIPLDVNFLIDRNSEPMFSKENVLKSLSATLDYLAELNVIDYSLILVVEIENNKDYYLDGNRFQLGIVDYLREFGAGERIYNIWKGSYATVVEPTAYKARMLKNIRKYFTQIPL